jgi:insertion element IS1 protein InsB
VILPIVSISRDRCLAHFATLEKKDAGLQQVNEDLLQRLDAEQVQVTVHKVEAAEVDEMWSFVGSKHQQRWLWHAIDHHTGQV